MNPWIFGSGFLLMMLGVVIGNMSHAKMVEQVNAKFEKKDRYSPTWWYWTKSQRLWKSHRELGPNDSLRRRQFVAIGTGIIGFLMVATQLLGAAAVGKTR
jgi:hypothetical protein